MKSTSGIVLVVISLSALSPWLTSAQEAPEAGHVMLRPSAGQFALGLNAIAEGAGIDYELGAWQQLHEDVVLGVAGRFWDEDRSARLEVRWLTTSSQRYVPTISGRESWEGSSWTGPLWADRVQPWGP